MLSRCRPTLRSLRCWNAWRFGPGCSVKDSFAVLDLEPSGFHVLLEATWIRRASASAGLATTLDWHRV
jgi:hypothetical protein